MNNDPNLRPATATDNEIRVPADTEGHVRVPRDSEVRVPADTEGHVRFLLDEQGNPDVRIPEDTKIEDVRRGDDEDTEGHVRIP